MAPLTTASRFRVRGGIGSRLFLAVLAFVVVAAVAFMVGPRNAFGPNVPTQRAAPPPNITALDAWLQTSEAAYSLMLEDEIGTISHGKRANFTVLTDNPLRVDPLKIKDIAVWGTVMEGRVLPAGETFFVDLYAQEFSRDIEPMRGGYGDNYYWQMVANIRRYKGVRPVPTASPASG